MPNSGRFGGTFSCPEGGGRISDDITAGFDFKEFGASYCSSGAVIFLRLMQPDRIFFLLAVSNMRIAFHLPNYLSHYLLLISP